jgi:ParB family chromosome partitioning protein
MLIDEMLSSGHARALLAIENKETQYNLACKIFDEKLNVRETEKLVKKVLDEKPLKEVAVTKEDDVIYRDIEDKIRKIVGTKVLIHNKKKNKGSIEIEYYSSDELERIIELFESIV